MSSYWVGHMYFPFIPGAHSTVQIRGRRKSFLFVEIFQRMTNSFWAASHAQEAPGLSPPSPVRGEPFKERRGPGSRQVTQAAAPAPPTHALPAQSNLLP